MSGRLLVSLLLGVTVIFGGVLWYFQNYAFYEQVTLVEPITPQVEMPQPTSVVEPAGQDEGASIATSTTSNDAPKPAVPGTLGDVASAAEPEVDTETLAKPGTGGQSPATNAPAEAPAVVIPAAKVDGTTPIDPDAANAAELPEAQDNIKTAALSSATTIRMTRVWDNLPEVLSVENFQGIDANTSPLKFKGCFSVSHSIPMMTETYVVYDNPTPLKAPIWFHCYRHKRLSQDIESGEAVAFLGEANITYGIDRVIAVYGDGRAYVWHQINHCGRAAFAGEDLPTGCPPKAER